MPTLTRTMRAVTQHRYGGTEQLSVADVAVPTPGPGEVLVRVEAAGVDRGVWHLMTGRPLAVRMVMGVRGPRRPPGMDLSGTVAAVGDAVAGFAVGDEVLGIGRGAFAEYAVAPAAKLVVRPPSLTAVSAAALPISGLTALQAVRAAGVEAGQTVLVLGAAGGVGSYAVQIARHRGAIVTGVSSAAKKELVTSLGADRAAAYDEESIGDLGRFDVIIDTGGSRRLGELRSALTARGTLVIVGGEGGGSWFGMGRQACAAVLSPFVSQRLTMVVNSENAVDLAELTGLVAAGHVVPAVERTFTLDETAAAIDHLVDGKVLGKVVVVPGSSA